MGFPVGYTEVFIPSLLLHTLTFLTLLKNLLFHLLPLPLPDPAASPSPHSPPSPPPLSAVLLRELLPLVCRPEEEEITSDTSCAVCLQELSNNEEIRWLDNCKHIFHRDCLDRWMDLDHRTCPLCRTPFLKDGLLDEFNQRLLAAHNSNSHDHSMYVEDYDPTLLFFS